MRALNLGAKYCGLRCDGARKLLMRRMQANPDGCVRRRSNGGLPRKLASLIAAATTTVLAGCGGGGGAGVHVVSNPVDRQVEMGLSMMLVPDEPGVGRRVMLNWNEVDGAVEYRIERTRIASTSIVQARVEPGAETLVTVTVNTYTDKPPGPGTYSYLVEAYSNRASLIGDARVSVTLDPHTLATPTGLKAVPTGSGADGVVDLSWTAVSGASEYQIYRNGKQLTSAAGTVYADAAGPGLFSYQVVAFSSFGESQRSLPAQAGIAPDVPAGLAAVPTGAGDMGEVALAWGAVPGAEGYLIYRNDIQIEKVSATSHVDAGPGAGRHSYQVVSYNRAGNSSFSFAAAATISLGVPDFLAARPLGIGASATVSLSWHPEPRAEEYWIYRNETLFVTVTGTTTYLDVAFVGRNFYRIAAYSSSLGTSQISLPHAVKAEVLPATPTGLTAVPFGTGAQGEVALQWQPAPGADRYRVLRNDHPVAETTETSYRDRVAVAGTYGYAVVAIGADVEGSESERTSATILPAVSDPTSTINLEFVDLPPPNPSDEIDYRTDEFMHIGGATVTLPSGQLMTTGGLDQVGADKAYQRGYFGQGVTVGVVDNNFDFSHSELAGNLLPGLNTINPDQPFREHFGHGSQVAGVIGAVRNGGGTHGVAPEAKLLAYQFSYETVAFQHAVANNIPIVNNSFGLKPRVFGRLVESGATVTLSLSMAVGPELLAHPKCGGCKQVLRAYADYKEVIAGEDIVLVWAAGNQGFNSDPNLGIIKGCRMEEHPALPGSLRTTSDCKNYHTRDIVEGFTMMSLSVHGGFGPYFTEDVELAKLGLGLNSISDSSAGPSFHPELLGRWVAVTGVTTDKRIVFNGCGSAKHYCMSAPGYARDIEGNEVGGTSIAAPYVSGALAVLKSRFPDMPMYAILAILFHTAEDLGEPGIDEVFGRGFLDLDAATSVQGTVAIALEPEDGSASRGVLLAGSAARLPRVLRSLSLQAQTVSVAVNFLDSHYYNMPLTGLFKEPASSTPSLGEAASDMLDDLPSARLGGGFSALADTSTGELSRIAHTGPFWRLDYEHCRDCAASTWREYRSDRIAAPFFAAGGQAAIGDIRLGRGWSAFGAAGFREQLEGMRYRQLGVRWKIERGAESRWSGLLELSRTDESDALLGGEYEGALAVGDSATYQGRLRGELALGAGWRLSGSYTAGWTEAEAQAGSMIAEIGGIRFAGWRGYLEGRGLLTTSDALRIGLVRQTAVESGYMLVRHGVVEGEQEFSEEHYMNLNSSYERRESRLELGEQGALVAQIGYALSPRPGMRAAIGMELARDGSQGDDYAAGFELRWDL